MMDIGRAPDTPFLRLVQNSSGDLPKHVIAPMPVITALRSSGYLLIAKLELSVLRVPSISKGVNYAILLLAWLLAS